MLRHAGPPVDYLGGNAPGATIELMEAVLERPSVGDLLRVWRRRRHLTQLELALAAGVSTRHLSFVETGRSQPSPGMVMHLSAELEVPLRERNQLLLAAGYAPAYAQNDLDAPELGPVRDAIDQVLRAHHPYPALVIDRHWGLVSANAAVGMLIEGVAPDLVAEPANVLRLSLHPDGMAPRIANLGEWRAHLLDRLGREIVASGDPALAALRDELAAYPGPTATGETSAIAVPLRLRAGADELAFISTVTTFGTATDVTVSELSIESFFPADAETAERTRTLVGERM